MQMKIKIFILVFALIIPAQCRAFSQSSEQAADEFSKAEEYGLAIPGFDEDYNKPITREEYTELIMKLYDKILPENEASEENAASEEESESALREPAFIDTENPYVLRAYSLGIVNGTSEDQFSPGLYLTREEAVTLLTRAIFTAYPENDPYLHAEYTFIDDWQISYWAKNAVSFAYSFGIINGTDDYVISPLQNISRKEAVVIVVRTFENIDKIVGEVGKYEKWSWHITPQFDGLVPDTRFCSGLAAVKKDGKYGYINTDGKTVIGFLYDRAYDFSNGMGRVELDGKTGYVDRKGRLVIDTIYEGGGDFSENLAWVVSGGKYGFIDIEGNVVVPFEYDNAYGFSYGMAAVKKDGLYGYINRSNETVIDFKFKWATSFKEERARIGENGRYGYIDTSGEIVIPCKYEHILEFNEERAIVYFMDFAGCIDRFGNEIVPFYIYTEISSFSNGVAFTREHGRENPDYSGAYSLIDRDGNAVGTGRRHNMYHEGLVATIKQDLVSGKMIPSYCDKKGNIIIPNPNNETISKDEDHHYFMEFSEGLAAVVDRRGKLGFIKNPLLTDK
jgi:hypothetical protein